MLPIINSKAEANFDVLHGKENIKIHSHLLFIIETNLEISTISLKE